MQILRKEERAFWNHSLVVDDAVTKRVESCEDGGAAWRTERGGDESVLQVDAIPRHRIHVRRLRERMPEEAHRVVAMIIRKDEDDVARLRIRDGLRNDFRRNGDHFGDG